MAALPKGMRGGGVNRQAQHHHQAVQCYPMARENFIQQGGSTMELQMFSRVFCIVQGQKISCEGAGHFTLYESVMKRGCCCERPALTRVLSYFPVGFR